EYGPLGVLHLPPALAADGEEARTAADFLNELFTYDQVGLLQRRLLEVSDNLLSRKESRHLHQLKKRLFFSADINRLAPRPQSGFMATADRLYSFGKIIEVESLLHEKDEIKCGQIRIADILKNGNKSIVMANNACKMFIDHKNGGAVYGLDFREISLNVCAAFAPERHGVPQVLVPGKSKTSFCDHILPAATAPQDFRRGDARELGDLLWGPYNYTVKKNPGGVRAIMRRRAGIMLEGRNYPLTIEKVFGLEKDEPSLSFVYHLENPTLSPYTFLLAIELNLVFPGALMGQAAVTANGLSGPLLPSSPQVFKDVRSFSIDDASIGCQFAFSFPKELDVWFYPLAPEGRPYQGTCCILSSAITLEANIPWKLMGTLSCKKNKKVETAAPDAF
ncbi:MAG: DUF1926 domain-containing protein, partial [Chitinivibrionales bacterium]|nr:DUF1926 domain-containing protein [Chitinivibrionales bacterium]